MKKTFAPPAESNKTDANALSLPSALKWALDFLKHQRFDEAQSLYEMVLREFPKQPDALHFLGVLNHQRGKSKEGLELIKRSLPLMPSLGWPWNNYGNVLLALDRPEEALDAYRRCVTLDPRHAEAHSNVAALLIKNNQWIDAERASRAAIACNPEFATAFYLLSQSLIKQKRIAEGLQASYRAIAIGPRDEQSRERVCTALIALGEIDQATTLYREWLEQEPDNPVVQHQLAALKKDDAPARAPDNYVKTVFDGFAESFDSQLAKLDYCAPQLVAQRVRDIEPNPTAQWVVGDLGCGTGLCGSLIKPWAKSLVGCDLSGGMLVKAAQRGSYTELIEQELVAFLEARPNTFDLLICADTLCYFGDLQEAFTGSYKALIPGGRLVFTVEAQPSSEPSGFSLTYSGRYAHCADYIQKKLEYRGFRETKLSSVVLRTEKGLSVQGWLVDCRSSLNSELG